MINRHIYEEASERYRQHFGIEAEVAAYAPGRLEVLGNHTDYNEGFVLSAAIDYGAFFLASREEGELCRLVAGDLMEEVSFPLTDLKPYTEAAWPNYIMGVVAGLKDSGKLSCPFKALFLSSVPRGAGLASSAALSISAGLALSGLYELQIAPIELAKIGRAAEHEYVGVRTGLLDQISSLYGKRNRLVMTDFRSLKVESVPMAESTAGGKVCFLACNTRVKHSLVDSAYNERRSSCEEAVIFFAGKLDHTVKALRDVSLQEWERFSPEMDPVTARRAAHIIGENSRVLEAGKNLEEGNVEDFGKLMFQSHESSRVNFENSCRELDFLVDEAGRIPGVLGARLSGGGFGGSVVVLLPEDDVESTGAVLSGAYEREFGSPCDVRVIRPSEGAHVIDG